MPQKRAACACACSTAALLSLLLRSLSYAGPACCAVLCRMAKAALLSTASELASERSHVMYELRRSLGQNATPAWRWKAACTTLVQRLVLTGAAWSLVAAVAALLLLLLAALEEEEGGGVNRPPVHQEGIQSTDLQSRSREGTRTSHWRSLHSL